MEVSSVTNAYGGQSTPWPLPKQVEIPKEVIIDLVESPIRLPVKDVVKGALQHLDQHPDAALLAYRLLSQRFAISG